MSTLKTGLYTITAYGGKGGYVARQIIEGEPTYPRKVVARPKDAPKDEIVWKIEKAHSDRYILSISGDRAVEDRKRIYTVLTNEGTHLWKLQSYGDNLFAIMVNTTHCWGLPLGDPGALQNDTDITSSMLGETFASPVKCMENQLFLIEQVAPE